MSKKIIFSLQQEKVHDASQMFARGSSLQTQQPAGGRWISREQLLSPRPFLEQGRREADPVLLHRHTKSPKCHPETSLVLGKPVVVTRNRREDAEQLQVVI